MKRQLKPSILIIDDLDSQFQLYNEYLVKEMGFHADFSTSPREAVNLVAETMYDVVVCDVKQPYRHAPFGGVILGEEIAQRCGNNSVLLISEIIHSSNVREESDLPFLRKADTEELSPRRWFKETFPDTIRRMIDRQYGFVAMPYENEALDSIYRNVLRPAVIEAGYNLARTDEEPFTRSINRKTEHLIRGGHFVVLVTEELNPNAFFEAGFASALKKHIVVCTPDSEQLPFNIRDYNCLSYARQTDDIAERLQRLLEEMRLPRGGRRSK